MRGATFYGPSSWLLLLCRTAFTSTGRVIPMVYDELRVKPGKKIDLKKFSTDYTGKYRTREDAEKKIQSIRQEMLDIQYKLYADNRHAVLFVLQGIDASGKDGICRHVFSALDPQGTLVTSFKAPSAEELDHEYMWRIHKAIPNYGNIGVFNRSYYEDVLVVRVKDLVPEKVWKRRYHQITEFERYLSENNIHVVKLFIHISKKEQEERFLERLLDPKKNWKFSADDLRERQYWGKYMDAFEDMLEETTTDFAPWYIIPGDKKWFRNIAVAEIVLNTLENLPLKYPKPSREVLKFVKIANKTKKLPPPPSDD